ncbi:mechanosensitive ion channel family protein [Marinimicrobium alkaliphilum]|uniref:mechanosensitive ion channel family protein n=1 Tax=Marinimicrobium alkaliphilum TaxID=2202654 RepID=UPI000DBA374D|nr:mechanosensitive ion channel domain-containing protein [Marinimicrobium alkaliphilum]
MSERFNTFLNEQLAYLQTPGVWVQLLVLLGALSIAALINRRLQVVLQAQGHRGQGLRHIAIRSLQRLLWPVMVLLLLLPGIAVLDYYRVPAELLSVAVPVLVALAAIRSSIYILRKSFTSSPLLKSSESALALLVWLGVVLHLLGWLPAVLEFLDSLAVDAGDTRISVLSVFKLMLLVTIALTLAMWLSSLLNNWLKTTKHVTPSMQVGFAKFSRFIFMTLAFLLALNAVGINLSTLAVFGGALGVGLGFGLQRIASNFISGFILVMDRSIKPGDVITVGEKFGWVEELKARYVVVRNREGVDTLIPNENLITTEVINWSYSDRNVRLDIPVQISYDDDPEQAMAAMLECAFASDRVLKEPAPAVRLMEFADSGIELHLMVWIGDPENGSATVKSDTNLAIWRAFKREGITIPYPQRDLHIKSGLPAALASKPDKPA